MLTKQDFLAKAFADIDNYPKLATLYRAGDPTITQNIGAIATMLAMFSQEQEAAVMEVFTKDRDSTILADAAMRGLIPKAVGVRVEVKIENPAFSPIQLETQRILLDSNGDPYYLEAPVMIPAGGTATAVARQGIFTTIQHTVSESTPFYSIEVPKSDDGSYLASITVYDNGGYFEWRNQYTNTEAGDRIFHVEVDDRQRVYVRFGYKDVVGYQPANGDVLSLVIGYSVGDTVPASNSKFVPEYTSNLIEAGLKMELLRVVTRGQNPMGMEVLRELARYPSVYSDDAVFLGEFDFLVRKNYHDVQFSSVWNEAAEEQIRGASLQNINALYVAVLGPLGTEQIVHQPAGQTVAPVKIKEDDLTDLQRAIRKTIYRADDSYRVWFYTPVTSEIVMDVSARVASSYNKADVTAQIRDVLLKAYGKASPSARRGFNRPLYQLVYEQLKKNVPALSGGDSDWKLVIQEPTGAARPELWRYLSETSLTVTVETVNIVIPSWGA